MSKVNLRKDAIEKLITCSDSESDLPVNGI